MEGIFYNYQRFIAESTLGVTRGIRFTNRAYRNLIDMFASVVHVVSDRGLKFPHWIMVCCEFAARLGKIAIWHGPAGGKGAVF